MTNEGLVPLSDVELSEVLTTSSDLLQRRLAVDLQRSREGYRTALGELGRLSEIAAPALEQVEAVKALMHRDYHIAHIREGGYGLQHGFPCRTDLLNCPVNLAMVSLQRPPAPPGYYRVRLGNSGEILIGEKVNPDTDLLVDGIRAAFGM